MLETQPLGAVSVRYLPMSIDSAHVGKYNGFLGASSFGFFIDKPLYHFSAGTA
jgi:hypothetical protein